MSAQFQYMDNPQKLVFETVVQSKEPLDGGKFAVILENSYFYPTGGGQAHDLGSIGEAQVLDVYKNKSGSAVIHVIDRDIPLGRAPATIDPERRKSHMQHHSGQHLLSQCFHQLFEMETLSAHIGGFTPSYIDLPDAKINQHKIKRIETLANQLIFENRLIKSYVVEFDKLDTIPLRRPPKVAGAVRVIEIESFDYSACGGTHCAYTGMIGILKILKIERQNQKSRVYFTVGQHAVDIFRRDHNIINKLAHYLGVRAEDIVDTVLHQSEQLASTQKMLQKSLRQQLIFEAKELAVHATSFAARHIVLGFFNDRSTSDLRTMANVFKDMPQMIALLANHDGEKISMLATCALDTGISARELLKLQLRSIDGRGGGDDQLAQGGGSANAEQAAILFAQTQSIIEELLNAVQLG